MKQFIRSVFDEKGNQPFYKLKRLINKKRKRGITTGTLSGILSKMPDVEKKGSVTIPRDHGYAGGGSTVWGLVDGS